MTNNRAFYPVVIFTGLLILAIIVGNAVLVFFFRKPIDDIPNIFKFIVHGISMAVIAAIAKKYFVK